MNMFRATLETPHTAARRRSPDERLDPGPLGFPLVLPLASVAATLALALHCNPQMRNHACQYAIFFFFFLQFWEQSR